MSNNKSLKALFLGSNIKSSIIHKYNYKNYYQINSKDYFFTDINTDFNRNESSIEENNLEEYLNNFDIIFLVYDNDEKDPIRLIKDIWEVLEKNDSKLNARCEILLGGEQDIKFLGFTYKKEKEKRLRESVRNFIEEKGINDSCIINIDYFKDIYDEINELLENYITGKRKKKVGRSKDEIDLPCYFFCLIQ